MILAFDTSAGHVCAALLDGETIRAAHSETMARGQAERLMPLLEEVLTEAGAQWSDLSRIGVGIGPGNFTGIRISVATARGLALGLAIPAIGVSTIDAIHFKDSDALAAVPAPRGMVYVARHGAAPRLVPQDSASQAVLPPEDPADLARRIARVAAARPADSPRPAPLYVKPADAAPASDPPPVILDDA